MVKNKNILSISNLKKSYDDFLALSNINLNLNTGEYVVLLGPNRAGKSTLFSILTGMLSPDLGDCVINGYSIKNQNVNALKAIGIVFQQSTIDMELSILENLNFHARLHGLNVQKLKQEIYNELKTNKLNNKTKNKVRTLSGGERRRVEISRTLAIDPDFILLDEPFAGVDPIAVEDIQSIVQSLKEKNIGVLITDHNVRETLSITDRSYLLFDGKILKSGTSDFLTNDKEVRKLYLGEGFSM